MRKLVAACVIVGAALVFSALAYAVNTYKVTPASTTPGGKGSASKPKPKSVAFGFQAVDSSGGRASPISKYAIDFQGLVSYSKSKKFKRCSFGTANGPTHTIDCRKARMGGGTITNFFGVTSNPAQKSLCSLRLTLYNLGGGLALRLDGGSTARPPTNCPIPVGQAINGKLVSIRMGGLKSTSLRFNVPSNLRHPLPNVDNSVASVQSVISRKLISTKIKGKTRKVGFLSSVACRGSRRTLRVTFTDETGKTTPVSKSIKC